MATSAVMADGVAEKHQETSADVYADNTLLEKRLIEGDAGERKWVAMSVDLAQFASREVTLRLDQRALVANRTAGNALWRNLKLA